MKSEIKLKPSKPKELKPKKKIVKKQKEPELDIPSINSNSYFRIIKELEKQNSSQKIAEEAKKKENQPEEMNQ